MYIVFQLYVNKYQSLSLSLSLSLTHTHTRARARAQTHTRAHAHTRTHWCTVPQTQDTIAPPAIKYRKLILS